MENFEKEKSKNTELHNQLIEYFSKLEQSNDLKKILKQSGGIKIQESQIPIEISGRAISGIVLMPEGVYSYFRVYREEKLVDDKYDVLARGDGLWLAADYTIARAKIFGIENALKNLENELVSKLREIVSKSE